VSPKREPSPKNRLTGPAGPPQPSVQLTPPPGVATLSPSAGRKPALEKLQTTYKQLSHAAIDLNTASDELGKPIRIWEGALKRLNLGVSAWVELSSGGEGPRWWDRSVGYTKLKEGSWGIGLRTREGRDDHPDDSSEDLWPFNDAPRWMRVEAVGKLPDLLDALLKQAEDTTKNIRTKIEQANRLAEAISRVADDMGALPEGK
jgi:hypothetical protein